MDKSACENVYSTCLKKLSQYLTEHHNQGKNADEWKETIILMDEYDAPINSGFENDYLKTVEDFMRTVMSSSFKDNRFIRYGVLTGCLRVAKTGILSGLNNLTVYSVLNETY